MQQQSQRTDDVVGWAFLVAAAEAATAAAPAASAAPEAAAAAPTAAASAPERHHN